MTTLTIGRNSPTVTVAVVIVVVIATAMIVTAILITVLYKNKSEWSINYLNSIPQMSFCNLLHVESSPVAR